jgi:hypothetical protein
VNQQRELLKQVQMAVNEMDINRQTRIQKAKDEIALVVSCYGEDGAMALALLGLTMAAHAEEEDEEERIMNAVLG